MRIKNKEWYDSMTPEERSELAKTKISKIDPKRWEEIQKNRSEQMIAYNNSLSPEEKIRGIRAMQKWHANLTEEAKQEFYKKTHAWYYALSDDDKETYAESKKE